MRVAMLGDICGRPGRDIVRDLLPGIIDDYACDLVVANGENAAGGFGLTARVADELFAVGVDVITGGNHLWDQKEMLTYIATEPRVLRPANYPPGVPGKSVYLTKAAGMQVAVLSMSGRVFMGDLDCPFRRIDHMLTDIGHRADAILVDFHGEATSEKVAFGWYLDGRVSAVVGTHTHVPTADHRILPEGTAYTTDLGMCGPLNGVLGMEKEPVITRFLEQLPKRFSVAKGPAQLCGVVVQISNNGKAHNIERIYYEKNIL